MVWLRPLLTVRRAALRALLRARGWSWVEDPSNRDPARDRARARAMLRLLPRLGLTPERLAMTARHMADARLVLDEAARQLAARAVLWGGHGEARLSPAALSGAPRAILGQLLADLLTAIGGRRHPPRLARIEGLIARLDDPPPAATLHGCLIRRAGAALIVCREPARAAPPVPLADGVTWDRRWRILGPAGAGLSVGALGLPAARAAGAGPGAEILATTPAIRSGGRLVAAPLLGPSAWRAEPVIPDARRRRVLTGL
ncbi:MAG: hypothetical protein KatS3mg118_1943 [Paracoccaceae bacterium]|nr:MAG: hypothetical protein KatS3mg118_1943 [Paracoccaceae bacterium]